MFSFLTKKSLGYNLVVVLMLLALVILLFFGSLDFLTKHNQYEKVPSVLGKNVEAAIKILESKGFEVQIQDSIYVDTIARQAIVKQVPEGDAVVKINRTVFLTVNRTMPPLVEMPNLVGFTLRNAQMYLQTLGLHMGDTTFKPDIAKNAVIEQSYNGKPITPGTKIFMGSTIDFVLGDGIGDEQIDVPDLINMTFSEAKATLISGRLNFTPVVDGDVIDTANAFIYRQNPEKYTPGPFGEKRINKISAGQNIDIYLSVNKAVLDSSSVQ